MSLENYTGYIPALVITNPTATDPKSEGDDALRGIKKTLAMSFVGFTEPAQGVTVTASQINAACQYGAAGLAPVGSMTMWLSSVPAPTGWLFCRGQLVLKATYPVLWNTLLDLWGVSTTDSFYLPDMRGSFARGSNGAGAGGSDQLPGWPSYVGQAQSAANTLHAHTVTISGGSHTHTMQLEGTHQHTVTGAAAISGTNNAESGGARKEPVVGTPTADPNGEHRHTIDSAAHTHTNTVSLEGHNTPAIPDGRPYNHIVEFIVRAA